MFTSVHGDFPFQITFFFEGEELPTDVGSVTFVLLKVLKYQFVSDVTASRAEIPTCPKVASPVAFL